jgi:hypothetical protein
MLSVCQSITNERKELMRITAARKRIRRQKLENIIASPALA